MPGLVRAQSLKSLKPVSLLADWVYGGPNAGLVVAKEKGFFADAGLDVTINQGKGSGNTAQIVASKAVQFGFADGFVVGNSVSKGMKLKMVPASIAVTHAPRWCSKSRTSRRQRILEARRSALPPGSRNFSNGRRS